MRPSAAAVLGLVTAPLWPAAAPALTPRDSVRATLVARDSITIAGIGCGAPGQATLALPAGSSGVKVRRPRVGERDLDARVTGVQVDGTAVTVTAVGDGEQTCDPEADDTPPPERPWTAVFDVEAGYTQRVGVVLRNLFPLRGKRVAVRPRRVSLGLAGQVRNIRWQRFGGRTAIGRGAYRSGTPCAGGCGEVNGTRITVRLTRPVHCPSDSRPRGQREFPFYGKVAFVVRERLGTLKPGTEWISTRLKECPAGGRPVSVR